MTHVLCPLITHTLLEVFTVGAPLMFPPSPSCSAQNVKKWESEMQTLKNNNTRLTTALEESTQHVAEWKKQLQKYKEESDLLKKKVGRIIVYTTKVPNL